MPGQVIYQTRAYSDEELYHLLTPIVKSWFSKTFPTFGPPQRYAIMDIHSRKNTLVCAPTGSGKTLTAFLSVLNELVDSAEKGILENRIYCVYISPLKALNNDIARNLITPLAQMQELSAKPLGIRVGVRTGDTSTSERARMLAKPPHILITTPESLGILLASPKFSGHLSHVDWCIVDEIHSLAENKRGVHLSLLIERLQSKNQGMCRIGLSATVSPLEEVARYLAGSERDVNIVDVQYVKSYDLDVYSPVENLIETPYALMHASLYLLLHKLIQEHKTTVIFTNTRSGTERVVDTLRSKYPSGYIDNIGAHHGSMSKEARLDIENKLRSGALKVCVSSTSLELGIDIGFIDLVVCLGSPKSVARFLQRCGRAGHKLHDTVKGRLIVTDRDDLVECAILLKNARERKIDSIHLPTNCLDVLAQTIIGFAVETNWKEEELYHMIRQSYCYRGLSLTDFNEVLQYLSGAFAPLEERMIFAKIWRENGSIGRRGRLSRVLYMTNIGTIPDETYVLVKIGDQPIGKLDEGFLERLRAGDVFVLGGQTYEFRFSRGMVAQVRQTLTRPPTVPSWASEMLPLSFDLACDIGRFRRLVAEHFQAQKSMMESLTFIREYIGCNAAVAGAIHTYLREQYDYVHMLPNDKLIMVEHVTSPEGSSIIFHTMFGRRVNDCLSRAIAFIISRKTKRDVEVGITDNGFSLSGAHLLQVYDVLRLLQSEKLDLLMSSAIEHAEVYKRRFRHCAERALMILRNYLGRKKTVGRSQVSAQILLAAVKRVSSDFTILREAKREVLEDVMDIENARKVIKGLETGTIQVREVRTTIPSPFAFSISLQGRLDVMKMEDRSLFLRRMHAQILERLGRKDLADLPPEQVYAEAWNADEEKKKEEMATEEHRLMQDAEYAVRRLKLPHDYLTNLLNLIRGEKVKYRQDFVEWVAKVTSGPVSRSISDELAKFLKRKKDDVS